MNQTDSSTSAQPLSRRNFLYVLGWLLVFCASATFCLWQVVVNKPFHSNLLELLPKDERNPGLHELSVLMASRFEDKLLILIRSDNPETTLPQAKDLQTQLLASGRLSASNVSQAIQQELIALYRPFSQQLLSADRRLWLQNTGNEEIAEQTYRDLFSPVALPRPYGFAEDPFNLGGAWLASLVPRLKMQEYQGFPLVIDEQNGVSQSWLLVTARLNSSPFDMATQKDVTQALDKFRQQWPDAEILTSGMIFHAAAGTEQATQEINTVGLGSAIAIVLMVLAVFRRATPLLAVFLSMTSAYLLALTVSLLMFGRIHVITLAFGSTLLGVAGDYAIHFLVTSHATRSGLAARHHLKHAMAIGALTGIGAYLLQFTTPFPGLQQMAIFCAAGIFGAWMTVLALAPLYRVKAKSVNSPIIAAERFFSLAQRFYPLLWAKPRAVDALLLFITAVGIVAIVRGGVNDAIVNLNTSPAALLAAEGKVQRILQQPSVNSFFYIEAKSPEQLLQRTQTLSERLTALNDPNLRWQSLQQYIPSQAQQQADRTLIATKLYGDKGALKRLCEKLNAECAQPPPNENLLKPEDLKAGSMGELLPPMLQAGREWKTLVTLSGSGPNTKLDKLADGLEGVRLVNQTEDLSDLLGRYRGSVSVILLLTISLLTIGLTLGYRQHGWRMVTPLVIAMIIALGFASLNGITLFHVMALLLIIGIGLDTAVFYTEGGFNAESWLASSLSCGTSIIAFGLLSLSAVPVLHQFGLIILVGILSCWLITPLFFRPRPDALPFQESH
ncbi:MAG: hypothetical protein EOO52_17595 [Gammaproteobacteria bacterium]|nr:MAG: hypothetical protein EOO52_17595 [Gammaproteobacteria bacterium]